MGNNKYYIDIEELIKDPNFSYIIGKKTVKTIINKPLSVTKKTYNN